MQKLLYRGTLLIRNSAPLGPYSRTMTRGVVTPQQSFRQVMMMQKLYALVEGAIVPDSPDSLHCQEVK